MPEDRGATTAFLASGGRPLVEFHRIGAPLGDISSDSTVTLQRCKEVAVSLDQAVPPPVELLKLIDQVADRYLAEMLVNDITAKAGVLRSCNAGGGVLRDQSQETSFAHTIVQRRLNAYGIR